MKEISEINSSRIIVTTEVMANDMSVILLKVTIGSEKLEPIFRTTHYILAKGDKVQAEIIDLTSP